MKLEWKNDEGRFASGSGGFAVRGGTVFFQFFWDASRSKGGKSENPLRLTTNLPGIKKTLGNFESPERCKEYAEFAFDFWLKKMNLEEKK